MNSQACPNLYKSCFLHTHTIYYIYIYLFYIIYMYTRLSGVFSIYNSGFPNFMRFSMAAMIFLQNLKKSTCTQLSEAQWCSFRKPFLFNSSKMKLSLLDFVRQGYVGLTKDLLKKLKSLKKYDEDPLCRSFCNIVPCLLKAALHCVKFTEAERYAFSLEIDFTYTPCTFQDASSKIDNLRKKHGMS